ncbi:hypothetical protein [Paraburkholderia dilworthii]|uniref:Uncharacterized protein n=1 Tax=Paraburkholderia dilworthii TaxID=948106 RepID=A0ABW9DFQ1_9BURK
MSPSVGAFPEDGITIGMRNPVEVDLTPVADDMSLVKDDAPLATHAIPQVVHGPAYYPVWRVGESPGRGRLIHSRGDGFSFQERDDDK